MRKIIIILFIFPLLLCGQNVDLSGGNYKVNATAIELDGEVNVVGVMKLQGSTGTSGQVLLSAGGGNTVWGTVTVSSSLQVKDPVACASTANLTLSGEQTIDGVVTSTSRVLVKNQTSADENGIYVSAEGAWSRASDAATWDTLVGAYTAVSSGTVNAGAGYYCTITTGVLGTDNVTWSQFTIPQSLTAGDGLGSSGNTWNVNVDDATVEINSDNVRAKTAAVTNGATTLATGDHIYDAIQSYSDTSAWVASGDDIRNKNTGYIQYNTGWKWMAYGDSYTATDSYYTDQVQKHINFSVYVNEGVGGNTIGNINTRVGVDLGADPNYFDDVDIMTVQFGINDWGQNVAIGTVAAGLTTFITTALGANPAMKLFVITPPMAHPDGDTLNTAGYSFKTLCDTINAVSYRHGIPVIDWYGTSGFNVTTNATFVLNWHPTAAGAIRLGDIVAKAMLNYR